MPQTGSQVLVLVLAIIFFFNDTATTEIYTLSLHDALPICSAIPQGVARRGAAALFRCGLDKMVIFYLAGQAEGAVGSLGFHPHHPCLAFESQLQLLSVRIVSWDTEGADEPLPGRERYTGNTVESAAAQIPGEALHCVRPVVAEQQHGPMQVVACSFPALGWERMLQLGRLTRAAVDCGPFQGFGGDRLRCHAPVGLWLPSFP